MDSVWRSTYSIGAYYQAEALLKKAKSAEAVKVLDLGIMMGSPVPQLKVQVLCEKAGVNPKPP